MNPSRQLFWGAERGGVSLSETVKHVAHLGVVGSALLDGSPSSRKPIPKSVKAKTRDAKNRSYKARRRNLRK